MQQALSNKCLIIKTSVQANRFNLEKPMSFPPKYSQYDKKPIIKMPLTDYNIKVSIFGGRIITYLRK